MEKKLEAIFWKAGTKTLSIRGAVPEYVGQGTHCYGR
jgi:hypothetical protein